MTRKGSVWTQCLFKGINFDLSKMIIPRALNLLGKLTVTIYLSVFIPSWNKAEPSFSRAIFSSQFLPWNWVCTVQDCHFMDNLLLSTSASFFSFINQMKLTVLWQYCATDPCNGHIFGSLLRERNTILLKQRTESHMISKKDIAALKSCDGLQGQTLWNYSWNIEQL